MEVSGQHHAPAVLTQEEPRYQLNRKLGGPRGVGQDSSGEEENTPPPRDSNPGSSSS
jgi:hypothetical protein